MASSFSTDLKLELQVTGENPGTWGTKTNQNFNLLTQAIVGFESIAITSTNTTLLMTDLQLSTARNAVLKFTGTLAANATVFVASGIEKTYMVENATTGAYTLALNQVGGSSVIWSTTDKGNKQIYLTGTNAIDVNSQLSTINMPNQNEVRFGDADNSNYIAIKAPSTISSNVSFSLPSADGSANQFLKTDGSGDLGFATAITAAGGSNTQVLYNNSTAFAGSSTMTFDGTNIQLNNQADLRLGDTSTNYVALHSPATVATNLTLTLPGADGTANQTIKTNGSGVLTFDTASAGGIIKQVLITSIQNVFSTGSGSYTIAKNNSDLNTFELTITPNSSTNKIFVNVGGGYFDGSGNMSITRAGTNLSSTNDNCFMRNANNLYQANSMTASILDAPATTSATTYSIIFKSNASTFKMNVSSLATLLLMEVSQ
jgi:hypothetical protein